MRQFPVHLENDNNTNPTGGKRKIVYGLIAGEAGWILKPQQIINKQIFFYQVSIHNYNRFGFNTIIISDFYKI